MKHLRIYITVLALAFVLGIGIIAVYPVDATARGSAPGGCDTTWPPPDCTPPLCSWPISVPDNSGCCPPLEGIHAYYYYCWEKTGSHCYDLGEPCGRTFYGCGWPF